MMRLLRASRVDVPEILVPIETVDEAFEPAIEPESELVTTDEPVKSETVKVVTSQTDAVTPVVRCRLFGSWQLQYSGDEVTGFTPQMRETVALLALHRDGLTPEALGLKLWPDSGRRVTGERVRNAVGKINTALRTAAGMKETAFVERVNGRHRLNPTLIGCDVWDFETGLREAAAGRDCIQNLQRVADVFDRLLPEVSWPWIELLREDAERRGRDALARLAELLAEDGNVADAADALERAIQLDGTNEEVHRRLMQLRAAEGHVDVALQVYRRLEHILRDLDLDPTPETITLVEELTRRRAS